jgi:hypothetical protein
VSTEPLRADLFDSVSKTPIATLWAGNDAIEITGASVRGKFAANAETLADLGRQLAAQGARQATLDVRSGRAFATLAEVVIAMLLAQLQLGVCVAEQQAADIVFAHAFPLRLAGGIERDLIDHFELVVESQQLVVLARDGLHAVETESRPLGWPRARHRRLLRRNSDLKLTAVAPARVLERWPEFCAWRFGVSPSAVQMEMLALVFARAEFVGREYCDNDGWVASSLVFSPVSANTLFDVLGPWRESAAWRRPGVFTGVMNLVDSQASSRNYCLCYGRYAYKGEITSGFDEIVL